jgi:hypothetical protein
MSRAFVKDGDDLPKLRAQIARMEPYPITALGRAKLESAHRDASNLVERASLERALELPSCPTLLWISTSSTSVRA